MKYEITINTVFSASHQLRLPDGSLEPLHGHNWAVELCVGADALDAMDCVCDFHELERALEGVVASWRNRHLNDVHPFSEGVNPSAERVAETIATATPIPPPAKLLWVRIEESSGCFATYRT